MYYYVEEHDHYYERTNFRKSLSAVLKIVVSCTVPSSAHQEVAAFYCHKHCCEVIFYHIEFQFAFTKHNTCVQLVFM